MYLSLLEFLRCPSCDCVLDLESFAASVDDVSEGILYCREAHFFPVVAGVPRFLPDSLEEHWPGLARLIPSPPPEPLRPLLSLNDETRAMVATFGHDRRTQANFSLEWQHHKVGDRTWSMELEDRVECFFLDPIRIPREELAGKLVLDAGCGNGSQSVAYTEFGCEVIAVDLSSGLLHGHNFRNRYPRAEASKVHFIQADLQHPPLATGIFDVIHSAGVLHHTPDTRHTFDRLAPLLKPGGTFYVWLYKYEPYVTPLVNTIRRFTTPIPAREFARIAQIIAVFFQGFCLTVNALGIRAYARLSRREATLALMDIFGAPYAHYHSDKEVSEWYRAHGAVEVWGCNDGRRGFGICGRFAGKVPELSGAGEVSEPLGVP